MESNNLLSEIQKQVEYYLSDENLKRDEFFYNIIKESPNATVPVDTLLNCNKLKKLGATKENVVEALAKSDKLKIVDASGVKRSSETDLPEFEPKPSKVIKHDKGATKVQAYTAPTGEAKQFEPKIFKITLSQAGDIKWDKIQSEIQKATDAKIGYTRVNGTEGHFAVDLNKLDADLKAKIVGTPVKIGEIDVKIEECLGDDLKKFYNDHGGHLDMCLERSGLKKKGKDRKGKAAKEAANKPIDFVFGNRRYNSLGPLKNIFKGIVMKTSDDEEITGADHDLLVELLKYHDNAEEKSKDLKHFTVGTHPLYKQTRCFFVVRNDGTKEDFSSTKCIENIRKKYDIGDE